MCHRRSSVCDSAMYTCFPHTLITLGNQRKHTELNYEAVSPGLFSQFYRHLCSYFTFSHGNWAIKITWALSPERFPFLPKTAYAVHYMLSGFQYLPSTQWCLCWAATVFPEDINVALSEWNTVISRAISAAITWHWHSNREVCWPGWGAALFDCRLIMSSSPLLLVFPQESLAVIKEYCKQRVVYSASPAKVRFKICHGLN